MATGPDVQCIGGWKWTLFTVTPSAHGLRAEPRRQLLLASPWVWGVGLWVRVMFPEAPCPHTLPSVPFCVQTGRRVVGSPGPECLPRPLPQEVLWLGWLQACLLPACVRAAIPIAMGRFRLESAAACVTSSLRCLLPVTRDCGCGTQL